MKAKETRKLIINSLENQGFLLENGHILPPADQSKRNLRLLHALAVKQCIDKAEKGLRKFEPRLLRRLAAGPEVNPERLQPRLVEVKPDSEDELLFRYACLHWSIPVSSGYGRRLRFLVIDEQNEKLIGLFGLGDPIFSLSPRDNWIAWDKEERKQRLHHVMDAFVLGAVPPYSFLLCGKLIAMLVTSDEVRKIFQLKYGDRRSLIQGRSLDANLALITTTSALGRSSLYRRITFDGRLIYQSVGFTSGSGEFHFANGIYRTICEYATQHCQPTAKHRQWGTGFRNRRETVRKCLASLGLSPELAYHRVKREIFVIPLAQNAREFLRGEQSTLELFQQPAEALFDWFRERWLLPRAGRDQRYLEFLPDSYTIWNDKS